jgi:hypothetical protein
LVYDKIYDRIIMYGGLGMGYTYLNDTWMGKRSGDSIEWIPLNVGSAGLRYMGTAIFDEENKRMIIFGGQTWYAQDLNDVWVLDLSQESISSQWKRLYPSGDPPQPRSMLGSIYDPLKNRMIIFGGYQAPEGIIPDNYVHVLYLQKGGERWEHYDLNGAPPKECVSIGQITYYHAKREMIVVSPANLPQCVNEDGRPKVWVLNIDAF